MNVDIAKSSWATIASVCLVPNLAIWSIAPITPSTWATFISKVPYSVDQESLLANFVCIPILSATNLLSESALIITLASVNAFSASGKN
ncbi:unannotated protein [freshwater metagenome]|uniref:Unannotated protein n=1 Tax=freshwater metagenome TaxID=449393 RepID=A0A6J7VTT0_9ZZZZ